MHSTIFYRRMSQRRAGGRGQNSKLKRVCGAEGCEVQVVGTELPYHYKARTDFEKLGELRRLPEEMAEERLKDLDPHTVYMFRKKHTSLNLPKWNTHKPVPKSVPQAFGKKDLVMKLLVIKPGEYDSEGTARAVVKELMATLGISRARLAIILLHFAYDGVYATKEERVGGGGSLNLVKFVAAKRSLF